MLDPRRDHATRVARSREQEEETATSIGGRRVSGSGAAWHSKGDTESSDLLGECKFTDGRSYSLKLVDVVKNEAIARSKGKVPFFKIEFDGKKALAVIDWDLFVDLWKQQSGRKVST